MPDYIGTSNDEEMITVRKRGDSFPRLAIEADGNIKTGVGTTRPVGDLPFSSPITGGPNSKALQRFRTALAGRNAAPCDIFHLGDSITWDYAGLSLANRWTSVFRDTLRTRFPCNPAVVGGHGFISSDPTFDVIVHTDTMSTIDGTATAVSSNFGPDLNGLVLDAASEGMTITFTGTGLDLFYAQFGGGGTFSYAVDGGGATNIVTNGATNYAARNQAIRSLSVASHTVVIRWVSGLCYFTGAFAYNGDETKGIRSTVAATPTTTSGYWWDVNHYWTAHIPQLLPDLVTIQLGPNDYGGVAPLSVATFKSNVQAIIADVKSKAGYSPSFVLLPVWPLTPAAPLDTWEKYVTAMYEIAAADSDNVCICDWGLRTSMTAGTTIGGILSGDFTHPSTLGNRYLGEQLAQFVSPF